MPDKSRAFGSRIEVGLSNMQEDVKMGIPPDQYLHECADRLSIAYALDLFIGNKDRHFGNFLFRRNSLGSRTIMPIDYSHAWWIEGWPPVDITQSASATRNHLDIVRAIGLWRSAHALMALGTLSQIRKETIDAWLQTAPNEWVDNAQCEAMLNWWGSSAMQARVSECVKYCQL
jgi:hypothetical protein